MVNLLELNIKKINSYFSVRDVEKIEFVLQDDNKEYIIQLIKENKYIEGNYCGRDEMYEQLDDNIAKRLHDKVVAFIMSN